MQHLHMTVTYLQYKLLHIYLSQNFTSVSGSLLLRFGQLHHDLLPVPKIHHRQNDD